MSTIEQAAQALLDARASGTPRGPIASEYALTDLAAAYAVQHALITRQLQGERPAGYKLGLTDARARQALGVAEPLRGVLLAANEYQAGSTLKHADSSRRGWRLKWPCDWRATSKILSLIARN